MALIIITDNGREEYIIGAVIEARILRLRK